MNSIYKKDNELSYNEWIDMNQEWVYISIKENNWNFQK